MHIFRQYETKSGNLQDLSIIDIFPIVVKISPLTENC